MLARHAVVHVVYRNIAIIERNSIVFMVTWSSIRRSTSSHGAANRCMAHHKSINLLYVL